MLRPFQKKEARFNLTKLLCALKITLENVKSWISAQLFSEAISYKQQEIFHTAIGPSPAVSHTTF